MIKSKEKNNEVPLEIQKETNEILKLCNKNQLLWIYERYFNKIYSVHNGSYNPCIYLYQQGLEKETPPGIFSDIIVMQIEMDSEREKKIYDEYILTKSLEYLKS